MECKNCGREDDRFRKGYCTKCYPLTSKIQKIDEGILPRVLEDLKENCKFFDEAKKEYVRQITYRLQLIKESRALDIVSAHDLEYRINGTLRVLDGKTLGKINDPLAHYLKDDRARAYVYQLFTKIQLLKPFKINNWRLYEVAYKGPN